MPGSAEKPRCQLTDNAAISCVRYLKYRLRYLQSVLVMPLPRLKLPWDGHHIGDGIYGFTGKLCSPAIDFKRNKMSGAAALLQEYPTTGLKVEYHDKSLKDASSYVAAHDFCSHVGGGGGYGFVKASASGREVVGPAR